ncbi:DUF805 domain-containing protein [Aliirhizobium terrae]|uniref:DUF805 domain-containing protein n=1 Tax=Terrirhizobium terrae TaxID=2926709 RepID=UPI002578BAC3|nr:DUF805 domain-containing protein [Rhizobium sp. CC-CFT758]WJH38896.1 DUF805 domain-containing protein [Rhizobium sp. CC-CFT758]
MTPYFDGMRRYFIFSGRSTRSQYWLFSLTVIVLGSIAVILDAAVLGSPKPAAFTALVYIAHLIPSLAVTVRRLHDADKSGWLALLLLVPLVNLVCYVVFGFLASTPGANRFGMAVGGNGSQQATGAPVARDAASGASTVEQLEKVASLRAAGAIDGAEYDRLKADAIKGARQ